MSDTNDTGGNTFGRGEAVSKGPIIPKSANEALRPERVPQPPRRSRKARSQLVIFLNFVMTAIVFITIAAAERFDDIAMFALRALDVFRIEQLLRG